MTSEVVTGIDSSAMYSFTQIKQAADEVGARLVLVNLAPEFRNAFHGLSAGAGDILLVEDLDHALEFCEERVITAYSGKGSGAQGLRDWFARALGNADYAEALVANRERLEVRQNEIIASQGDPPDHMHFIVEGRVGIMVQLEDGRSIRVRSLGAHTTIGEMGLITGQLRSATIKAEMDSVLYALSREAYERLKREDRQLSQALMTYVITVMAERLSFASKVIGVLRR